MGAPPNDDTERHESATPVEADLTCYGRQALGDETHDAADNKRTRVNGNHTQWARGAPRSVPGLLAGLCGLAVLLSGATCQRSPSQPARPFTLVMLPDTQHYSRKYPELFLAQTQWIKENRRRENIVFVTHVGDIVNNHGDDTNQWEVADKAMSMLDGVVPWGVAIGNHDFDSVSRRPGEVATFLKYFGPQRSRGRSWFGGSSTNGLNSYQLFSGGGIDFLILHLELDVPDAAIDWASDVLCAHPHRAAIVTTHSYLNGVTGIRGYNTRVSKHGNAAEDVWHKLIRRHPQIFLVLCGHHQRTVAYHQVSINDAGAPVIEMLADYQKEHNGGDAWLRLLRFVPAEHTIQVRTFSPALNSYRTDPKNQFDIPFEIPAGCRPPEPAHLSPRR